MSLSKKFNMPLRSLLASIALLSSSAALAKPQNKVSPLNNPSIIKTIPILGKYKEFEGKDFDTRVEMHEEILQRYNQQHGTQFSDISMIFLTQTPTHSAKLSPQAREFLGGDDYQEFDDFNYLNAINDVNEIICLGRLLNEIDTSLPYAEQLRSCGFDLLADIASEKTDISKLSDMQRAKLLAQLEYATPLANLPSNEKANLKLHSLIYPEDVSFMPPLSKNSSILNGRKLNGCTLYEEHVIKKVFKKLMTEQQKQLSSSKAK